MGNYRVFKLTNYCQKRESGPRVRKKPVESLVRLRGMYDSLGQKD